MAAGRGVRGVFGEGARTRCLLLLSVKEQGGGEEKDFSKLTPVARYPPNFESSLVLILPLTLGAVL